MSLKETLPESLTMDGGVESLSSNPYIFIMPLRSVRSPRHFIGVKSGGLTLTSHMTIGGKVAEIRSVIVRSQTGTNPKGTVDGTAELYTGSRVPVFLNWHSTLILYPFQNLSTVVYYYKLQIYVGKRHRTMN